MPGEEPRTWNAIIGSRSLRSTGVQTGQSRLHFVREQGPRIGHQNDTQSCPNSDCVSVDISAIWCLIPRFGGADRDRTDDLKLAKLALSQLSYGPVRDQLSEVSNQIGDLLDP